MERRVLPALRSSFGVEGLRPPRMATTESDLPPSVDFTSSILNICDRNDFHLEIYIYREHLMGSAKKRLGFYGQAFEKICESSGKLNPCGGERMFLSCQKNVWERRCRQQG